jgi:hypothetical protein
MDDFHKTIAEHDSESEGKIRFGHISETGLHDETNKKTSN